MERNVSDSRNKVMKRIKDVEVIIALLGAAITVFVFLSHFTESEKTSTLNKDKRRKGF